MVQMFLKHFTILALQIMDHSSKLQYFTVTL